MKKNGNPKSSKPSKGKSVAQKKPRNKERSGKPRRQDERREFTSVDSMQRSRTDLRNERTTATDSNDQALATCTNSVIIDVGVESSPFAGVAASIVSFMLQKGWQAYAPDANAPYQAWVYLIGYLMNEARDAAPLMSSVPKFVNLLSQALKPKSAKYGAGLVSYKFTVNSSFTTPSYQLQMTSGGYWTIGVPTSTLINGYWPQQGTPSSYDAAIGATALASLFQFAENLKTRRDMVKMVPAAAPNRMSKDVSVYATPSGDPGSGFAGYGAPREIVSNETGVQCPVFSVFTKPTSTNTLPLNRGLSKAYSHGSDPFVLGGMLAGVLHQNQVGFKLPPVYKCLDFNEFVDVGAYICQRALQLAFQDIQVRSSGSPPIDYVCPLTFLEFQLMLRNVMMTAVADSQYFAQGLVFQPVTSAQNTFNTFKTGVGCYGNSTVSMPKFPVAFIEMINCNTMRVNYGGKRGHNSPNFYIPVLGTYVGDELQSDAYFVTYLENDSIQTIPVFKPNATKVGKETVSIETPISMTDGSDGTGYCYINNTEGLNALATAWNTWYDKLAPFFDTSDTYSIDGGVSVLSQSITTNHYLVSPPEKMSHRYVGTIANNVYRNKQVVAMSSVQEPLQTVVQYTTNWVRPTNAILTSGGTAQSTTPFAKMSVVYREPYSINATSGGFANGSLATYHYNFATSVTRARNGEDSGLTKFVLEQRKRGTGGILSSLAAAFIPVAGNVATQLALQAASAIPY